MKFLAFITFCLSFNLVASEIVPSISRSKRTRYDGMISKSWKQSGKQVMIDAGEGEGHNHTSKFLTPYIEFNSKNINFNGSYKTYSGEAKSISWQNDANTYQLELGAKINSKTTVTAAYYDHSDEERYGRSSQYNEDINRKVFRIGMGRRNDNVYYGFGVDSITTEYDNPYTRKYGLNSNTDKRRRYTLGGGSISTDQQRSFETLIAYTKTGDSDINFLQVVIATTLLEDHFEVSPSLSLSTSGNLLARVTSDYMLTDSLFVAPVLRYEVGNFGKREMAGILGVGLREEKYEVGVKYRDTLSSSEQVTPFKQFSLELARSF